ncbi:hypothetical protein ACTFIV_008531 [Dictyostelium citrinum]
MHESNLKVKQLMSKSLFTINLDTTLDVALKSLNANSIHRLPVVDNDGNLKGIITDRDLRLATDSPFLPENNEDRLEKLRLHKVSSIMKQNPVTIEDFSPVVEAAKLMRVTNVGGLPVLDKKGRLIGMVTRSDLLDLLIKVLEPVPPQS